MRKILSSKILKRIFCACGVFVILVCCAVPVFAIGTGNSYERYNALPFNYLNVSGWGGPIDYLGTHSRVGTRLAGDMRNYINGESIDWQVDCDSSSIKTMYLDVPFSPASGAEATTAISFNLESGLGHLSSTNLKGTRIEFPTAGFEVTCINVYVDLIRPTVKDDGTVGMTRHPINRTVNFNTPMPAEYTAFYIDRYLYNEIPSEWMSDIIFFHQLRCTFYLRRTDSSVTDYDIHITTDSYGLYTEPLNVANWWAEVGADIDVTPPPPPAPNELNVVSFISTSLNSFVSFELIPGFSIGDILIAGISLGIFLWFLRLIH